MDCLGEDLICKAKSILSSLCGILLWVSRLQPCPVHSTKHFPTGTHNGDHLQLGFKILIYLEARSPPSDPNHSVDIVHSYTMSSASASASYSSKLPSIVSPSLLRPTLSSSSSSSSIMLDDLIGTESGVYLSSNENEIKRLEKYSDGRKHDHKPNKRYRARTRNNYPPPIPLLTQTGNFPSRMPWVFTRHYGDGKLILKIEKVKHHEYLEAYRENGRLILNLVPLDDVESEEYRDQELEPEDLHDHFEDKETDQENICDDQEVDVQYQEPEVVIGYDDNYVTHDDDEIAADQKDLMMTSLASSNIPVKIWLENSNIGSKRYDDQSRSLPKSSTADQRSENLRKCLTNNAAGFFVNPNAMLISTNAFAHA